MREQSGFKLKSSFQKTALSLLQFLLIYSFAIIIRQLLLTVFEKEMVSLLFKIILLLFFGMATLKLTACSKTTFYAKFHLHLKDILLILALAILFLINNLYFKKSDVFEYGNFGTPLFLYSLFHFTIASIGEELAYRGFLQTKINENTAAKYFGVSRGNAIASVLMLITHFGFLTIMPILQALPALFLVFIFSLIAGYLKDRYRNLLLPILVHIGMNYIHLTINTF